MFPSFVGGGFECSTHIRGDGRRLDLLSSTDHACHAAADYGALRAAGLLWARDGLRWHKIEMVPYVYRWDSWLAQLDAANAVDIDIWWDLMHFGVPDHLDIWSPDFIVQAAGFAAAAAEMQRSVTGRPGRFCPINEISFMAFAGGERAWMNPHGIGRGYALKQQLVLAAIAMARAVRAVDPEARLLWAEPLIHVACKEPHRQLEADAASGAQYEALDWLLGFARPELGGDRSLADVIGFNHYPHNQRWVHGEPLGFGTPGFRGLADMLAACAARYPGYPLVLAETGAEGVARQAWLTYIRQECEEAWKRGIPLTAACLYPVTDYPGWDDDRLCPTGLFGIWNDGRRAVHARSLTAVEELERSAAKLCPVACQSVDWG